MLRIRLMGRPMLGADPDHRRLQGMKPWALLASLVLADRPLSRRELADRIWPGTADPLASLRWSLLQVRRALEPEATVVDRRGRLSVEPCAGETLEVDARVLLAGRLELAGVEELVAGELLEGFSFEDVPELEQWLVLERARVASASLAALRWAATLLSRRDPAAAVRLLTRATRIDPFDDVVHELTVDALVAHGDRGGAAAYAARVEAAYARELGEPAPPTIRRPLDRPIRSSGAPRPGAGADLVVGTLLEGAEARLAAGDYAGAEALARRAASEAATAGDGGLEAKALIGLSATLIHSVRGRDREALGLLERGLALATDARDDGLAAEAERELGWVAFLQGSYGAAEATLLRAVGRSERLGDRSGAVRARMVVGACQSDRTEFEAAEATLGAAVEEMASIGDRWLPFAMAFLGRIALRTGREDEGRALGEKATATTRRIGWLSLLPWTLAIAGESQLLMGETTTAERTFEEGLSHSLEIGDPCWEAFSLRGMGLVRERQGDRAAAVESLRGAVAASRRLPDVYGWCEAVCVADLVRLDPVVEAGTIEAALRLTGSAPMPDLYRQIAAHRPA